MKLYLNQKFFSMDDSFKVLDINGKGKYYGKSESVFPGKIFRLYDMKENELAAVEERCSEFGSKKYFIHMNGKQVCEVVNKNSFFKERYIAEGLGLEIEGDFFARRFNITRKGNRVVVLNKKAVSCGDCYEIDIENESDVVNALALVIVIDCIREAREVGGGC